MPNMEVDVAPPARRPPTREREAQTVTHTALCADGSNPLVGAVIGAPVVEGTVEECASFVREWAPCNRFVKGGRTPGAAHSPSWDLPAGRGPAVRRGSRHLTPTTLTPAPTPTPTLTPTLTRRARSRLRDVHEMRGNAWMRPSWRRWRRTRALCSTTAEATNSSQPTRQRPNGQARGVARRYRARRARRRRTYGARCRA